MVAPTEAGDAAEAQQLDLAAERADVPLVSDDDLYAAIDDPASAAVDLANVDDDGATLELNGQTATLLDRGLLAEIAEAYRDAGVQP